MHSYLYTVQNPLEYREVWVPSMGGFDEVQTEGFVQTFRLDQVTQDYADGFELALKSTFPKATILKMELEYIEFEEVA